MTPRERVLTAFAHQEPDQVPRWCGASPEFVEKAKAAGINTFVIDVQNGRAVKCGDLVFARLREDLGGDLFFRIFTARKPGGRLLLGAYNPAHPAIEFDRSEFAWICPAAFSIRKLSA